jgi:enoyl-CoA hydratase/carnithine racemase
MTSPSAYPEFFASYQRAKADAAHKLGLISTVAKKGPKAVQAAVDTSARAEKRRDSFAKKLRSLGAGIEDGKRFSAGACLRSIEVHHSQARQSG